MDKMTSEYALHTLRLTHELERIALIPSLQLGLSDLQLRSATTKVATSKIVFNYDGRTVSFADAFHLCAEIAFMLRVKELREKDLEIFTLPKDAVIFSMQFPITKVDGWKVQYEANFFAVDKSELVKVNGRYQLKTAQLDLFKEND